MKKNNSLKINRLILLTIVFLFVVIIARILFLGLSPKVNNINLTEFANNRNTKKEVLQASRGSIFDVNGDALAKNVNSYTVIAYLSSSRTTNPNHPNHVVDKEMTARTLAPILNMDEAYILKLLNYEAYQVELGPGGRGITELKKDEIDALNLPGIDFISSDKRYYKMNNIASHIIGFARRNDDGKITGEMGIEKYYDEKLSGINGYKEYQRDAYGYQIPNTPSLITEPVKGNDVYLTIDSNIQLILENVVNNLTKDYTSDWITISVTEAKTGRIVGSASSTEFNLNTLDDLTDYLNPLVSYTYEPGSTMKIFSFLAAMENNKYDGNKTYQSGTVNVAGATIKDFNNVGWGRITYNTGFSYSSNVAATYLARDVGRDKLKEFYTNAGFGKKTGIELPDEMPGQVKFKYESELANASFGQGISVTPIQMLQGLTIISNDGDMLKPYIVDKVVDSNNKVVYEGKRTVVRNVTSKENTDRMRDMMKDVVYSNLTDAKFYKANNITVIGKTGTAQIPNPNGGGYLSGKYEYIRSFAGLFPYEDPEYIIYIATKRFVGPISTVAKNTATAIEEIAKYKDIVEVNSSLDESKIIKVENYLNKDVNDVKSSLTEMGLKVEIIGNGSKVIKQSVNKGKTILSGNRIFLMTEGTEYLLPNMVGYTSGEATSLCNFLNIHCSYEGYGNVEAMSLPKSSPIQKEMDLVLTLNK